MRNEPENMIDVANTDQVQRQLERPVIPQTRFYIASKTKHAPKWLALRASGWNIISTWIDEYEVGATKDFSNLAVRCIREATECDVLICYREEGEILKGAIGEMGAALSAGKKVLMVGELDNVLRYHPNVLRVENIDQCLSV